jgi:hypothetical protein
MTIGSSDSKNENTKLWILEQERQKDRANVLKQKASESGKQVDEHHCRKCKKMYHEPKLIYVCPHCLNAIEETAKMGCRYWFGYLNQKDRTDLIPSECVECEKVMECMLSQEKSEEALCEISKWY